MYYLQIILYSIISLIIITYMYIKIKYRFWSVQPVFHIYDFHYWLFSPGYIHKSLPDKNKFTNFKNIIKTDVLKLNNREKTEIIDLLQEHYLKEGRIHFRPEQVNIFPYFENIGKKSCLCTSYYEKGGFNYKNLIGFMLGKPLYVYNNNNNNNNNFKTYYVEYLCVHKLHRKKGIAPELIQTHDYFQRRENPDVICSLFKREHNLTGIVPLCLYSTYGFDIHLWDKEVYIHPGISIIEISKTNIHVLKDFLKNSKNNYKCFITTGIQNILTLIDTNNFIVYCVIQDGQVICCYFFRDSCTYYDDNKRVVNNFCNFNNCLIDDVFVYCYGKIIQKLKKRFDMLLIENNSASDTIVQKILATHNPEFISPTAYYFYNYLMHPVKPEEFYCIC